MCPSSRPSTLASEARIIGRSADNFDRRPAWAFCARCEFRTELREDLPETCPGCNAAEWDDRIVQLPLAVVHFPIGNLARGPDGHLYLAVTKETLAGMVVHFLSHPTTTEQHIALLRSMTTAEEWKIAEEAVRIGRAMVIADA